MAAYDYDLITLGAGSGGVRASRLASGYGARVAIIEESRVGGTCVIRGCVPKKILAYGAGFARHIHDARGYGWHIGDAHCDWSSLVTAKDREIARLEDVYRKLLQSSGVEVINGRGVLLDPHTVDVSGQRLTAQKILLAVGGRPFVPSFPGSEHVITSDEALNLPSLPENIVIVGGGFIALEFACIFVLLGSRVSVCIRSESILRGFDRDICLHVTEELIRQGINIIPNTQIAQITRQTDGQLRVICNDAGSLTSARSFTSDCVLYATGRTPYTQNLGLQNVGVTCDLKTSAVCVDAYSRTNVSSVWAIGDVTNRMNLTPVALHEGMCFAETEFNGNALCPDHMTIASAVFSQPPVATVGLSEEQARSQGPIDVYKSSFRPLKHMLSCREERTLVKLVVCQKTQIVLGAHMVGEDAPEIIQGIAIAVKAKLTKMQFDATIGIHPTVAEELVTLRSPIVS